MRNRFFIIVISMAVIFSMASGGLCATLSVKAGKTACEKKRHAQGGLTKTATGKCHVTPCQTQSSKVYLLPDTSSRRSQDEIRSSFSMPGLAVNAQDSAILGSFQAGRRILKFPSTFYPPTFVFPPLRLYLLIDSFAGVGGQVHSAPARPHILFRSANKRI